MSSFFMRYFGFQPTLWPTLFTVPALVVILAASALVRSNDGSFEAILSFVDASVARVSAALAAVGIKRSFRRAHGNEKLRIAA